MNIKHKKVVLHITSSLDFGGVEKHLYTIHRQPEKAMRHCFLAISHGGNTSEMISGEGGDVTCLNLATRPSITTMYRLYKYIRNLAPDVVHTHGSEANLQALPAAWLAGTPVRMGEEIGIPSHGSKAQIAFRIAYLFSSKVIGISRAVSAWLTSHREIPQNKSITIYNPVILSSNRASSDIPQNIFRIGFVGRLEPVKNPGDLLLAFADLLQSRAESELWFIGDGSLKAGLQQQARELGIESKVFFHGFVQQPEELVSRCSIYVQPSISEGFGIALVEAMSCGVPVIATAVGGAPEIIDHGKNGWLIPKPDQAHISIAIRYAASLPPDELHHIGNIGRKSVETRFSPGQYIQQLESAYNREAGKK